MSLGDFRDCFVTVKREDAIAVLEHSKRGSGLRQAFQASACTALDMKKELVFEIEQDGDMLVAVCHQPEMATQGNTLDELIAMIRDLIQCRFDDGDERLRWPIRLHFLNDPILAAQVA